MIIYVILDMDANCKLIFICTLLIANAVLAYSRL